MKFKEQQPKQIKNVPKRAKHQPKCMVQTAYMIHAPTPFKDWSLEREEDATVANYRSAYLGAYPCLSQVTDTISM